MRNIVEFGLRAAVSYGATCLIVWVVLKIMGFEFSFALSAVVWIVLLILDD